MPRMRHPRGVLARLTRATLALAALLFVSGCGAGPSITLRATAIATVAPIPSPPLAGPHIVARLKGISLVSRDEGWNIGRDDYYNGIGAFLLHYHDGDWRLQAFPAVVDAKRATPTSIAMITADIGWIAATLAPNGTSIILHERAGGWLSIDSRRAPLE